MKKVIFAARNKEKWEKYHEELSNSSSMRADRLAEIYIHVSEDLAYAKSKYAGSELVDYLNHLALKIHSFIYKNRREETSRFITFWSSEVPHALYSGRKELLYSLLIFLVSAIIGVCSAANDPTFVNLILGDHYVQMTLENIENGDPMAVYKSMDSANMFLAITINNIRVALIAFAMGILFSFGTGFILFQNGVMLGSFQYFFYEKGLFSTSFFTIWIHGTLEISAIIVAGGAGLVLGNSILFPGNYPRMLSFRRGAKKGLKMAIGLVPVFIMAGFLESFITRLTEATMLAKGSIILASLCFVIYYFIFLPYRINQK